MLFRRYPPCSHILHNNIMCTDGFPICTDHERMHVHACVHVLYYVLHTTYYIVCLLCYLVGVTVCLCI